jgi:hypothetical protein
MGTGSGEVGTDLVRTRAVPHGIDFRTDLKRGRALGELQRLIVAVAHRRVHFEDR